MAIYPVLDLYILCSDPPVGRCLGDDHAVSELEDLLDCAAHLRRDWEYRSSSNGEHSGLDVSDFVELF